MTATEITTEPRYLPDLDFSSIVELQSQAAELAGVPIYFSDAFIDSSAGDPFIQATRGPELSVIPAGLFSMGADALEFGHNATEKPNQNKKISEAFAIGRFTVTADEFEHFVEATSYYIDPDLLWNKGQLPVYNIRRASAQAYLQWLSDKTGQTYRLPTETEWEYAARAGTASAFHFGDTVSCKEVHFYSMRPYEEKKQKRWFFFPRCFPYSAPLEVGGKPANAWGLHDVHGNVWEMTGSAWTDNHAQAVLGAQQSGTNSQWYVTKGGSWFDDAASCRSAARKKRMSDELDTNLGFRVLREL